MKQVSLQFGSGVVTVKDVPSPALRQGTVLVATRASLISAGTERAKVRTAQQSLLGKARSRPDQVQQVLKKLKQVGFWETVRTVRGRLAKDEPLGYSCAGEVILVGDDVEGIRPGDRVACAGAGYANHAEVVVIPKHLCARIPDGVTWDEAAFATVGAIALHAVRQAEIGLGDRVLVVGLGLLGQLITQLASANGAVVSGIDFTGALCELARKNGATDAGPPSEIERLIRGTPSEQGFDVAMVAAADKGEKAFATSIDSVRDRGRVVIVGAVGIHIPNTVKSALYDREIEVRTARSYGPGRYDRVYEEEGVDYPVGYVRWTEQRNLSGFLEAVQRGHVRPQGLVTARFPIEEAEKAFDLVSGTAVDGTPVLGVLLAYGAEGANGKVEKSPVIPQRAPASSDLRIGMIGAGNFARANLLPHLKAAEGVRLAGVVTASGLSVDSVKNEFQIERGYSSAAEILQDATIHAVVIATRHDTHAQLVCDALASNKHVFVEKPLALSWEELRQITRSLAGSLGSLTVGFNRRFAPQVDRLRRHFTPNETLVMSYRINAGPLSKDSWYRDPVQGGGRFLGEGGHFIDTCRFLAGSAIRRVFAGEMRTNQAAREQDNVLLILSFENGSVASIQYVSDGDSRLAKERIEIFGGGHSAVLDDFQRTELYGKSVERGRSGSGKGHREEMTAWVQGIREGTLPTTTEQYIEATAATLAAVDSLSTGLPVELREWQDV